MKIGVIGDTHLGASIYGYDTTASTRRILYAFLHFCIDNKVDMAVHLGDLFDVPRPGMNIEKVAIQWANEFERAGIKLKLLTGNHDVRSRSNAESALDSLKAINYRNVQVIDTVVHEDSGVLDTNIVFAPFPSPWNEDSWEAEVTSALSMAKRTVIFSHLNVDGARIGDQDFVYHGTMYGLPKAVLAKRLCLVVNGHIHRKQWVNTFSSKCLVVGAAQRLRFSERGNACKFCLLRVDGKGDVTARFKSTGAIEMVQWVIDIPVLSKHGPVTTESLLDEAPNVDGKIVKVQAFVDGKPSVDWADLCTALYTRGAAHVAMANPTIVQQKSDGKLTRSYRLTPAKAALRFIDRNVANAHERHVLFKLFRELMVRRAKASSEIRNLVSGGEE